MLSDRQNSKSSENQQVERHQLDPKLAAYLAATASGSVLAGQAQATIVSNTTVQPFGINEEVDIDFNSDGQIDFQIDHDRVNLDGTDLDYLQIDKNDVSSAVNPLAVDPFATFDPAGTNPNGDHAYIAFTNDIGDIGGYPVALREGDMIGGAFENPGNGSFIPGTNWDFQEGDNFAGLGVTIRANRLIDEDMGQIDADAGFPTLAPDFPFGPQPGFNDNLDDWVGLNSEVRYVGLRVDLNDAAEDGLNMNNPETNPDFHQHFWYGWIGVRITNEADATGEVVAWAYESDMGVSIMAGDTGPVGLAGDFNGDGTVNAADYPLWRDGLGIDFTPADFDVWKTNYGMTLASSAASAETMSIPEPGSILLGLVTAVTMIGVFLFRRRRD